MSRACSSRAHHGRTAVGLALTAASVAGGLAVASPAAATTNHTVIAHRGDRAAAPENTIAAFRSAINKGVEAIEFDVLFSKSGYPVVFHDSTLNRTTNCTGKVSSKTVRQLHQCDAGSWFGSAFKGEQIPTLWDAMKYVNRKSATTQVVVHMKVTPTPAQAKIVMQRVNLNGMANRTIIMGSNANTMARMKAAGAKKQAFIFSSPAGWSQKYKIMVPYNTALTAREVSAAHARGAKVWTVEGYPLTVGSLLKLTVPVDGVMLNRLDRDVLDLLSGVVKKVAAPTAVPPVVTDAATTAANTVRTQSFDDMLNDEIRELLGQVSADSGLPTGGGGAPFLATDTVMEDVS